MTTDNSTTTWNRLGTFKCVREGQFKVIARSGSRVAHIDRLTAADAAALTDEAIEAFFTRSMPPRTVCTVSA